MNYRFPVSEQRVREITALLKENSSQIHLLRPNRVMASIKTLYKIGLGPSSSHTMGPNYAAIKFKEMYPNAMYEIVLYGSLAQTGKGHRTDWAIEQQLGPEKTKVVFEMTKRLRPHTNGMLFTALVDGKIIGQNVWYSVGGGIIEDGDVSDVQNAVDINSPEQSTPAAQKPKNSSVFVYPMLDFKDHAEYCIRNQLTLPQLVFRLENEFILKNLNVPEAEWPQYFTTIPQQTAGVTEHLIQTHLLRCWETMKTCVEEGLEKTNNIETSGALNYVRVAHRRYAAALRLRPGLQRSILELDAYALAVSEQNASASGLVVTAPTCGACGVLPGILYYYYTNLTDEQLQMNSGRFAETLILEALAVAGVVGNVCRTNASVSGAEAGCQAEVGVAQAMAGAAVAYVEMRLHHEAHRFTLGECLANVEWAARNSLKNNLGLTCDPVNGLVIDPCIQRNGSAAQAAMASGVKSVTGDYDLSTSFDTIVTVMYMTGRDMKAEYKETSQGGLAEYYLKDAIEKRNVDYTGGVYAALGAVDIEELQKGNE